MRTAEWLVWGYERYFETFLRLDDGIRVVRKGLMLKDLWLLL